MNEPKIEKLFNNATRSKQVHEAVVLVENTSGDFSVSYGYGGKDIDTPINTASIGKMYTTACILILCEKNKLSLADPLSKYFAQSLLDGLHIYKGIEYSHKLTVADLLFQTSGLPDWFEEGGAKEEGIESDIFLDFEARLERTKKNKPRFAPGASDKVYYSDFNFDLLGRICEITTKMPFQDVCKSLLFNPLGLSKTYVPESEKDFIPQIYYKNEALHRPGVILSSPASGGIVTTAREMMLFLKAFWGGTLFSKNWFEQLAVYRKLPISNKKGPIYYGGGYMQIPLGGPQTLFMGKGELVGHSGATASGAFYYPLNDLFIVCDFNQLANPAIPIRLTMRLAMAVAGKKNTSG